MKNEALYHKSVGILAKAYVDETLVHRSCSACAVGNLIASSLGIKFYRCQENASHGYFLWKNGYPEWDNVFSKAIGKQVIYKEHYRGVAKMQIDSTGYTWQELARIEYAFETNYTGHDPMFTALMAVIDVLDDIHEVEKEVSIVSRDKFHLA
jgi:hypothetical protein